MSNYEVLSITLGMFGIIIPLIIKYIDKSTKK